MAITVIQASNVVTASSVDTFDVPIDATGSGRLLVCVVMYRAYTLSVAGITDDQSQTWEQATGAEGDNTTGPSFAGMDIWFVPNTALGVTTVSVTLSGTANTETAAMVMEVDGIELVDPLDAADHVDDGGPS